ncbi:MAG: Holliday junction branch migration protein RuvA [Bacteroidetes bacterium]|nr:Holliday junction branch migration protein RuvA [Bacteroidota bacterium]
MYDFIEGNIESLNPTHVVISNQGLGYVAAISLTTYEKIKGHKNARLFVDLLFKVENQSPVSMNLYAFSDPDERHMFRMLTSVSGVGNNTAMLMLSSLAPDDLASAILNGNVGLLKSIKGIGEKSAQRIVLELRDKLMGGKKSMALSAASGVSDHFSEALSALTTLGYVKANAEKALMKVSKDLGGTATIEELIKNSLKIL